MWPIPELPSFDNAPYAVRRSIMDVYTPSVTPGSKFIDIEVLDELKITLGADEDPSFLQDLLNDYFEDATSLMQDIERAVSTGDAKLLKQAAHTLKSSSAMFGGLQFAQVCQEAENLGGSGTTSGAAEKYAWLKASFPSLCAELRAYAF